MLGWLNWLTNSRTVVLHGLATFRTVMVIVAGLGTLAACGPTPQEAVRLYSEGKFQEAHELLQLHASRKDPIASYFLAQMYERGDGVKPDLDRAVNLYMSAATRGLPQGQAALAALQSTAAEGEQLAEVLATLNRVAEQQPEAGLPRLCEALLYLASKYPDIDYGSEFLSCATKLQQLDELTALRLQASAYVSGALGEKDFNKGAIFAEQAAKQGDVGAHAILAAAYAEGLGKPQDFLRAYAHANVAVALSAGTMSDSRRNELERLQKRAFRNLSQQAQQSASELAGKLKESTSTLQRNWNLEHRFAWALQTGQG
jgi:uncharacterized protein